MARWNDNQPIYRQILERAIAMILEGTLDEGDALPSVRQVATDLQVNPITVSKAYQSLVDDGLVERRRGLGMFVCPGARIRLLEREQARFLTEEWPSHVATIKRLQLDPKRLFTEFEN